MYMYRIRSYLPQINQKPRAMMPTFAPTLPPEHDYSAIHGGQQNSFRRSPNGSDSHKQPSPQDMINVLYVEDDHIHILVMEYLLQSWVNLEVVQTPLEAIQAAESVPFQLVLMDIHLGPGNMNGVELMQHIRGTLPCYQQVPFFAVTTDCLLGAKKYYLEQGFDRLIPKPVQRQSLLEAIDPVISANHR